MGIGPLQTKQSSWYNDRYRQQILVRAEHRITELNLLCLENDVSIVRTTMKNTFRLFYGDHKVMYYAASGVLQDSKQFFYNVEPQQAISIVRRPRVPSARDRSRQAR